MKKYKKTISLIVIILITLYVMNELLNITLLYKSLIIVGVSIGFEVLWSNLIEKESENS